LYLFDYSTCSPFWQETRRKFGQGFEQAQVRLVPGDQQAHRACGLGAGIILSFAALPVPVDAECSQVKWWVAGSAGYV
jgi:hypothetical protein